MSDGQPQGEPVGTAGMLGRLVGLVAIACLVGLVTGAAVNTPAGVTIGAVVATALAPIVLRRTTDGAQAD